MPTNRKHIVLIEDDDSVRRSLSLLLRLRGFSVEAFKHGVDFLSRRPRPAANYFLFDYKMPGMSGLSLLERLRQQGDTTPAMLITGFMSPGLDDRARRAGFSHLFEKPVSGRAIADHISGIEAAT